MDAWQVFDSLTAGVAVIDPFSLQLQTYPNPSSGSFEITFTLQTNQNVDIELLDEQGRSVDRISEGFMRVGDHRLRYERKLVSGIYLLKLQGSVTGTSVRKLLIAD
jgi:hypothetical protein